MYEFALSALAAAHRDDLLRDGCLSRQAAAVRPDQRLLERLAARLPSRSTPVQPCTTC